jgi:hypothetical protein
VEAVAGAATIAPGQGSHILVTFDRPMVGMKDVLVKVASNDAVEPEQTLTLRFEVVP